MPSSTRTGQEERERRTFWLYLYQSGLLTVSQCQGLACKSGDYWWFPTVGFSIPVAKCHESYEDARLEALDDLRRQAIRIDHALKSLGGSR